MYDNYIFIAKDGDSTDDSSHNNSNQNSRELARVEKTSTDADGPDGKGAKAKPAGSKYERRCDNLCGPCCFIRGGKKHELFEPTGCCNTPWLCCGTGNNLKKILT